MEYIAILLFVGMPMVGLSWMKSEKYGMLFVALLTASFVIWFAPVSFVILLITGLLTYYIPKSFMHKAWAAVVITLQMASIFLFFKLGLVERLQLPMKGLIPFGLSYYAFRQIHYAIEMYKGQLPKHSLTEFLCYLFFLPTLLVGPINRFQPFLKDMRRRRWDPIVFSKGLERILYGIFKVVVLGNFLFSKKLTELALSLKVTYPWGAEYLEMFNFTANAYIQFSGFSDIAIGLALLMNIKVIENFNFPFIATNIADFWRRWHISLSQWCRDYVYYPFLGMTRSGRWSLVASMLILGMWHEISLRYLLWGALHAIAINLWHRYKESAMYRQSESYPWLRIPLGLFITSHFVMLSFVLIKEENLSASLDTIKALFLLG